MKKLALVSDENQAELANLDFVSHLEHLGVAGLAVNVGSVQRSHINYLKLAVIILAKLRVAAGHRNVIEENVCLGVAAGGSSRLIQQEAGTRIRATLSHELEPCPRPEVWKSATATVICSVSVGV